MDFRKVAEMAKNWTSSTMISRDFSPNKYLTKSEDELLMAMHPKTRYNIGVAQKKEVEVYESTRDEDFETYLSLYFATTERQK